MNAPVLNPPLPQVNLPMHCMHCDKLFRGEIDAHLIADPSQVLETTCGSCWELIGVVGNVDGEDKCPRCGDYADTSMSNCDSCGGRLPWADADQKLRKMQSQTAVNMQYRQWKSDNAPKQTYCQFCNTPMQVKIPPSIYHDLTHDVNGQMIPLQATCYACRYKKVPRQHRAPNHSTRTNRIIGNILVFLVLEAIFGRRR